MCFWWPLTVTATYHQNKPSLITQVAAKIGGLNLCVCVCAVDFLGIGYWASHLSVSPDVWDPWCLEESFLVFLSTPSHLQMHYTNHLPFVDGLLLATTYLLAFNPHNTF